MARIMKPSSSLKFKYLILPEKDRLLETYFEFLKIGAIRKSNILLIKVTYLFKTKPASQAARRPFPMQLHQEAKPTYSAKLP